MGPVLVQEETGVKCIYLYWTILLFTLANLDRGPVLLQEETEVKCLYLWRTTLLFTLAALHGSPVVLGLVLLQEKAEVPGENLQCLVESNWTTLLSHLNKVTLTIYIPAWSRSRTLVTVVRLMDYHCVTKHSLKIPYM